MREIRKVLFENKFYILFVLGLVVGMGVIGFFLHDGLIYMDRLHDEEMTVFPLGTIFAYLGLACSIILGNKVNGMHFSMSISMGGTRKQFFREAFALQVVLVALCQIFALGLWKLESWKFAKFYFPKYGLELDMAGWFKIENIAIVFIFAVALNIFLLAINLKFGVKAYYVMAILYAAFCIGMSRFDQIAVLISSRIQNLESLFSLFVGFVVALSVVMIVISHCLISKQEVIF